MSLITKITFINQNDNTDFINAKNLQLHDCLTDEADWNNEFWDFQPNCIKEFCVNIKNIFNSSTNGIIFQALWVGDNPEIFIELTFQEFINILVSNKVSTKAKYIVNKNGLISDR